jgi:hypothetical protein
MRHTCHRCFSSRLPHCGNRHQRRSWVAISCRPSADHLTIQPFVSQLQKRYELVENGLPGRSIVCERRIHRGDSWQLAALIACATFVTPMAAGRDLYVDPDSPPASENAAATHFVKIRDAIRIAGPGDTIHLLPKVYRDDAGFYNSNGVPGRPITLDGHGATLDGGDPLQPADWQEVATGLFRNDELTPLTDAMIDRWFFFWDGKMNRMGRVSKATSPPLPPPEALKPGEWTFVKDTQREMPTGYIAGSFYIRLELGKSLADANIFAPIRSAGVLITASNSNLVIRNLTATHVYNDGYNISGKCEKIEFQNIRAIDCGDDGISAHTDSQYTVDGFVSIGNATGICDTGVSKTDYRNVFIADCLAHDLFFIQSGQYSITNGVILSSARYAVTLNTLGESGPCCLDLKNVLIVRTSGEGCLSVAKSCELSGERVTLRNLDMILSGGKVDWNDSVLEGQVPPDEKEHAERGGKSPAPRKPKVAIAAEVTWSGDDNQYSVESYRIGETVIAPPTTAKSATAGVDRRTLTDVPIQDGYAMP